MLDNSAIYTSPGALKSGESTGRAHRVSVRPARLQVRPNSANGYNPSSIYPGRIRPLPQTYNDTTGGSVLYWGSAFSRHVLNRQSSTHRPNAVQTQGTASSVRQNTPLSGRYAVSCLLNLSASDAARIELCTIYQCRSLLDKYTHQQVFQLQRHTGVL